MTMQKFELLLPLIIYFIVIIAIGIYASRFSSKGVSEYFIGGRQMGRFVHGCCWGYPDWHTWKD
jgi:Na+/pantothenate symporter